jgi:hypothetical protein
MAKESFNMSIHSTGPCEARSSGLNRRLLIAGTLVAGVLLMVLLTLFGPLSWVKHSHAASESAVGSRPQKVPLAADTAVGSEPYRLDHSVVERQNLPDEPNPAPLAVAAY